MGKEKKVTLKEISEKTGISTSTLSRALNNCPGVEYETWKTVRDAAQKYGYVQKKPDPRPIGVLFPTVPEYFWRPALAAIRAVFSERGVSWRLITHTHRATAEDICAHIDTMAENGTKILLMPVRNEKVIAHLNSLRDRLTVFQVCEYGDIPNSFVFTSDGKRDGEEMAEYLLTKKPMGKALLLSEDTKLTRMRVEGFRSCFPKEQIVGELSYPFVPSRQRASVYARLFSEHCPDIPPDLIVCGGGILSYAAQAVIKCRWTGKTVCAGYENPPDLARYTDKGLIAATTEQDILGECTAAAKAAADFLKNGSYPSHKYSYLPGKMYKLF